MVPIRILCVTLLSATTIAAQGTATQKGLMSDAQVPTISSSATADAKYSPDRATISIAVQTKAPSATAAAAENATKQNAVLLSLRALGMANDQLSTTGYNVSPEYRYPQNSAPILTGYTVTNTILADVHDLRQLGKVLDTALANGSNVVSSLDFYASNTDEPRQRALTEAVLNARTQADVAARAAGGSLGPLLRLNVGGGSPVQPPRPVYMAKAMDASAPQTQINPGQQTVSVSVSGSWQFISNR